MKLNLNYLSKKAAEKKIDEVTKEKINIFQFHEILVWAMKNYKNKNDLYATCYFAEEVLEVTQKDILAMPIDNFILIFKERNGCYAAHEYLEVLNDVDMLFTLYEKLPMSALHILFYLQKHLITLENSDVARIANSKLGYNLIFRASILPTKEMRDKNIPFVTALTNVMEDQAKKIQLLNQFNEELFFEACETAKEKDFAKAVEMISEKRQAKILSENNLVKLKEVNPKFYDFYCHKFVKAA
ncbi:MAG: hypothetical protein ACK5N8_07905 [Alphaproteobacteria bacterium]